MLLLVPSLVTSPSSRVREALASRWHLSEWTLVLLVCRTPPCMQIRSVGLRFIRTIVSVGLTFLSPRPRMLVPMRVSMWVVVVPLLTTPEASIGRLLPRFHRGKFGVLGGTLLFLIR